MALLELVRLVAFILKQCRTTAETELKTEPQFGEVATKLYEIKSLLSSASNTE